MHPSTVSFPLLWSKQQPSSVLTVKLASLHVDMNSNALFRKKEHTCIQWQVKTVPNIREQIQIWVNCSCTNLAIIDIFKKHCIDRIEDQVMQCCYGSFSIWSELQKESDALIQGTSSSWSRRKRSKKWWRSHKPVWAAGANKGCIIRTLTCTNL